MSEADLKSRLFRDLGVLLSVFPYSLVSAYGSGISRMISIYFSRLSIIVAPKLASDHFDDTGFL